MVICSTTSAEIPDANCDSVLSAESKPIYKGFPQQIFFEDDKVKVRHIYANPGLTAKEKSKALFDIYLEARLREFQEYDRKRLSVYAKEFSITIDPILQANGKFATIPQALEDTIIPTFIAAHEFEHIIQFYFAIFRSFSEVDNSAAVRRDLSDVQKAKAVELEESFMPIASSGS